MDYQNYLQCLSIKGMFYIRLDSSEIIAYAELVISGDGFFLIKSKYSFCKHAPQLVQFDGVDPHFVPEPLKDRQIQVKVDI